MQSHMNSWLVALIVLVGLGALWLVAGPTKRR